MRLDNPSACGLCCNTDLWHPPVWNSPSTFQIPLTKMLLQQTIKGSIFLVQNLPVSFPIGYGRRFSHSCVLPNSFVRRSSHIERDVVLTCLILPGLSFILISSFGLALGLRPCATLTARKTTRILDGSIARIEAVLATYYHAIRLSIESQGARLLIFFECEPQPSETVLDPTPRGIPDFGPLCGPEQKAPLTCPTGVPKLPIQIEQNRPRVLHDWKQNLDQDSWLLVAHPSVDADIELGCS